MLLSLHVKNLALIEEEEVNFTDGLNILTGETGAGKSFIIGSVNLALGAKADAGLIREGADCALIELIFRLDNEQQRQMLAQKGLKPEEDDTILIKRRIGQGRSVCTVAGETVTAKEMREIAEHLMDLYGQRENQTLLRRDRQMKVVDEYAGTDAQQCKEELRKVYQTYRTDLEEWENQGLDEKTRLREEELLRFEVKELEEAQVKPGEMQALEEEYRRLSSFQKLQEVAEAARNYTAGEEDGASGQIERACRELRRMTGCDAALDGLLAQLEEIDSLLSDFTRELSDYADGLTFDPASFSLVEERLNLLNHLQDKYGQGEEALKKALEERSRRLEELADYEMHRQKLQMRLQEEKEQLLSLCDSLSKLRRKAAADLAAKMQSALLSLNFNQVAFEIQITPEPEKPGPGGYDQIAFMISMNPGEPLRPLDQIASGGELSRIMLGLKTVFAGKDEVYTFIFDEIDSGISGQTAWMVAKKLGILAEHHQILCITHLPQIAAMGDSHFRIAKETRDGRTYTHISQLNSEESCLELARLLGGAQITKAVTDNAREMKAQAAAVRRGAGKEAWDET